MTIEKKSSERSFFLFFFSIIIVRRCENVWGVYVFMLAVRLVMGAGVDRGKMKHSHVGLWGQKTEPWPWVFLGSVYVNSQDTLGANPIGLTISCCPSEGQRVPLSLPFWAWFQLSSVFFFPIKKKFSLIFSFSTPYVVFSTSWIPITY